MVQDQSFCCSTCIWRSNSSWSCWFNICRSWGRNTIALDNIGNKLRTEQSNVTVININSDFNLVLSQCLSPCCLMIGQDIKGDATRNHKVCRESLTEFFGTGGKELTWPMKLAQHFPSIKWLEWIAPTASWGRTLFTCNLTSVKIAQLIQEIWIAPQWDKVIDCSEAAPTQTEAEWWDTEKAGWREKQTAWDGLDNTPFTF